MFDLDVLGNVCHAMLHKAERAKMFGWKKVLPSNLISDGFIHIEKLEVGWYHPVTPI